MITVFELELGDGDKRSGHRIILKIIGEAPKESPYLAVYADGLTEATQATGWIPDDELEIFAVNILRAIKSKHLKSK